MKRRIASIILIMISAVCIGCSSYSSDGFTSSSKIHAKELTGDAGYAQNLDYDKQSMQPVQKFAYDLLAYNIEEINPVLSPVSAYIALCMAGNGAEGETKEEFRNMLGGDMMCIPDELMNILPQNEESIQLTVANSAWIDDTFTARKEWLGTVKSLFDASVYQADLDTPETKDDINQWVSGHTNQKIPKLLEQTLDEDAKLALVNALYFHADWENKFDAAYTRERTFRLDDGTETETDMMYTMYQDCEYFKDDMSEGVLLPYKDSHFAFAAIKPRGKESIREWYESCSSEKLSELIAKREKEDVELSLVKFTANCKKKLNESLMQMGLVRAFDLEQADFSSIEDTKEQTGLYLGLVLQEAVIETAEEGTEAAAATFVEADAGEAMSTDMFFPVTFDRSFLYMIMDMENEVPVFIGIMDNPKS